MAQSSSLWQTRSPRSPPAYISSRNQEPQNTRDKCCLRRWWDVLRRNSAVRTSAPGEVAMGQDIHRREWNGSVTQGKGQEQNTAAHLVLQQAGLKHAVLAAVRKVTRNLRTGNLIITKVSRDTSHLLMISSSLDCMLNTYRSGIVCFPCVWPQEK